MTEEEPTVGGVVTVSIPYYGCPGAIRRAVDAVLAQTHRDLLCVVTNDADQANPPWGALADIADRRLVRYDARVNRGRYYADAVVLAACHTPWFTVHDADDQADPGWLAACLAKAREQVADVVFTQQHVISLNKRRSLEVPPLPVDTREMKHYGHMAGLWRTAWLRQVGGPNPSYRIGYDTLLSSLAHRYGRVAVVDQPLYARHRRPGSLTTSRTTGAKSARRKQVRAQLQGLWVRLRDHADPALVGSAVRAADPSLWRSVERDAARLRRLMEGDA